MRIVWLSWKDREHPQAGGAETVSGKIMDNLVRDGNEVILITSRYSNSQVEEVTPTGIHIIRTGNRYSVYIQARNYFQRHYSDWPDLVVDEMNTIPFGATFYTKKTTILLTYQLARSVWFHQMPFPASLLGYIAEPIYLRALSSRYPLVLTESDSTRNELTQFGFRRDRIRIFRVGMALQPVEELTVKSSRVILSLGSVRPMKRTLDAVKAFEVARSLDSSLKLVVAGDISSAYGKRVAKYISQSPYKESISIRGRVTNQERLRLMSEAALILVTSIKEGWGLIVTEANSQGTPAIAYDTDGLRDSVQQGITGVLVANGDYNGMGRAICDTLNSPASYETLRMSGWKWSKEFTFENSYRDFKKAISNIYLLK